jgi:hypothetical protein
MPNSRADHERYHRRHHHSAGHDRGVIALGQNRQLKILEAVSKFNRFDEDNDPYGEHDFGALEVEGERFFFKIDYYDQDLSTHSPDPADPSVTKRLLTIILAEEY